MQLQTLLPIVLLVGVFYLLILRPARTRQKAQQETISSLAVGKTVMTTGGLFGTVTAVTDDRIELEIADGVRVQYLQAAVSRVVPDLDPDETDELEETDEDPVDVTKDATGGDTQAR